MTGAATDHPQEDRIIEAGARAAHSDWIEGLGGIEPTWEQLPESFKDRMRSSIRAAHLAMLKAQEEATGQEVSSDASLGR